MDAVIALVAVVAMFVFMVAVITTTLSKVFGFYELLGDLGDDLAKAAGKSLRTSIAEAKRKRG